MPDLAWQVNVLRELLAEAEKRLSEHAALPTVELGGPCIAKTRGCDTVLVFRYRIASEGDTHFYEKEGETFPVKANGRFYHTNEADYDIVEVVRLLTEKEIIDLQFHGIEPLIN